jgi:hypothetical protein
MISIDLFPRNVIPRRVASARERDLAFRAEYNQANRAGMQAERRSVYHAEKREIERELGDVRALCAEHGIDFFDLLPEET